MTGARSSPGDAAPVSFPNYGGGCGFWDDQYAKEQSKRVEWLNDYDGLVNVLNEVTGGDRHLRILHVGCGSSAVAERMYDDGYLKITNIDISAVVIGQMEKRNTKERALMTWEVMDATQMDRFANASFDLVIDKALMDTLACTQSAALSIAMYLKEVQRILRPSGSYLCICFDRRDFFLHFEHLEFECRQIEVPTRSNNMPHFAHLCRKPEVPVGKAENWLKVFHTLMVLNKASCEKVLSLNPEDARAWSGLGGFGGGEVKGQMYSEAECYEKALNMNPKNGAAWGNAGSLGGCEVDGQIYSAKQCFEMSLFLEPNDSITWYNLGFEGGVDFDGHFYSELECYKKSVSLDPKDALIWCSIGDCGGTEIDGLQYSEKMCFEKALSLDPKYASTWSNLGDLGGAELDGQNYSGLECYEKALSLDPSRADTWFNLRSAGGGTVNGQRYSSQECYDKAKSLDPEMDEDLEMDDVEETEGAEDLDPDD
eukprot:gnl/MRDRNA2_/MRDRNA2_58056_c0_seq1.p1 gnl/MRDRNA2_/MRDRNA2_58056_c0~~gnl/MRDRNA2_/MRDRNA2_58056_c0_seq1.p1  ORF type:complete len:522 (-),score=97.40 gnl/MRDRNA2_/MRDRNA2_58056_c0_seq1:102-1550(-)